MVRPPLSMGKYQFAVLSSLRAAQLMHGSVPRVETGTHKAIVVAQMEVAGHFVEASAREVVVLEAPPVGAVVLAPGE